MKNTLLFVFIMLLSGINLAQNHFPGCGFNHFHQSLMERDSNYRLAVENLNDRNIPQGQFIGPNQTPPSPQATVHVIPVVFHIMHTGQPIGTSLNIPDAQIMSAIDALNRDYRRTNADGGIAQSGPLGVDIEVEFCLAIRAPDGSSSTGINRINASAVTGYTSTGITSSNEVDLKALSVWDNQTYMNVWVVREIDDQGDPLTPGYGGGTQGYAYFPGAGPSVDGIVVLYAATGSDLSNSQGFNLLTWNNDNRTLTHEVGHYLSLYHTFEGGSCSENDCNTEGDRVCDTPPTSQGTGCVNGPCPNTNLENYMDYNNGDCSADFTQGQKDRMRNGLTIERPGVIVTNNCDPVWDYDLALSGVQVTDTVCSDSLVVTIGIKNIGNLDITSFDVLTNVDGGANSVYNWSGILSLNDDTTLTFVFGGLSLGNHTINLWIDSTNINGNTQDQNGNNNVYTKPFNVLPNPNISITANNNLFCFQDTIVFTASGGVSYIWNTGDNTESTEVVLVSGFNLEVIAEASNGCTINYIYPVTMNPLPTISANPSNANLCLGSSIEIQTTGGISYVWSTGSIDSTINVGPTDTTTYIVIGTDANGCKSADSVTINPYEFNAEILSTGPSVCIGSFGTLVSVPGVSYNWSTGDTTQSVLISPIMATNYYLTVTDSTGCIDSATINITVKQPDTAFITPYSIFICQGTSANFVSNIAQSYYWSTGDTSKAIVVVAQGDTTINLTVVDTAGCINTANAVIHTFDTIQGGFIDGNAFICKGDLAQLNAPDSFQYNWSTGDTTQAIQVQPDTTTKYSLLLKQGSCTSDTIIKYIQVLQYPEIDILVDKTNAEIGETVNFTYDGENISAITWDFDDGSASNLPFVSKSFASDGVYHVLVYGYNGICKDSAKAVIYVGIYSSINENGEEMQIMVFPNPVENNTLNVRVLLPVSSGTLQLSMYNTLGQLVLNEKYQNRQNFSLDVGNLNPGNYVLRVNSNSFDKTLPIVIR